MNTGQRDRQYWLSTLEKIAHPVLTAFAARQLKARMPVLSSGPDRAQFSHLEALGRLLTGMAPWLENARMLPDDEEKLRQQYTLLAREAIDAATDPNSSDYCNFTDGTQPIVDAAFLAQALLRAPTELWQRLDTRVQRQLILALKATRSRKPYASNWLLFSAMIETALYFAGEQDWDPMRIDYALKQHEQWYCGDGFYSDGADFHADYYNSFVIHPFLLDIITTIGDQYTDWQALQEPIVKRAQRYATVLERSISPEGTYPVTGRSLAYRFGAFQLLAQIALRQQLHESMLPSQVRCALTAVIRRSIEMPGTFDEHGWLTIGLCGEQPALGETYISTGSLYLCSTVFLPLGLAADNAFWQGETAWTAKKVWRGSAVPIDRALQ